MAVDNAIAIAALVISLVALLTTLLQLLQQYFATADGYRRCQNSVMAGWAKFTRRHFRWKEFRYETIFVVPDITFREELRPGLTGVINQDWQLNNADARMDFGVVRTKKIRQKEHDMFLEKWKSQRSWPRRLFTSIPSASALQMGSEKSEKVDPDGEHATTVTSKGQLWMVDASQQRDLACWVKLMHEINKMYDHMLWKENGIGIVMPSPGFCNDSNIKTYCFNDRCVNIPRIWRTSTILGFYRPRCKPSVYRHVNLRSCHFSSPPRHEVDDFQSGQRGTPS